MANSLFFSPLCSLNSTNKPGIVTGGSPAAGKVIRVQQAFQNSETTKIQSLKAANSSNQSTKVNSIVCSDCDGNGSLLCSQCQGSGVNSVDHFNGQFKAGGLCWLCRGKKEILCGSCNGAGFLGGFMSTFDE